MSPNEINLIRISFDRVYLLAQRSNLIPRDREEVKRLKREFSEAYNFRDTKKMTEFVYQLTEFALKDNEPR